MPDESWQETMRRLKSRMQRLWDELHIKSWAQIALERKFKWATKISCMDDSRWAHIISNTKFFIDHGMRKPGRPRMRWEDQLNHFAMSYGMSSWLNFATSDPHLWNSQCHHFVNFVLSD